MTGLSGSGKTSIAIEAERQLVSEGFLVYRLDGDNLRFGLNRDLGFSETDRRENVRRVFELSRLMADSGVIVLVGLISPYAEDRAKAREAHEVPVQPHEGPVPFMEVSVFSAIGRSIVRIRTRFVWLFWRFFWLRLFSRQQSLVTKNYRNGLVFEREISFDVAAALVPTLTYFYPSYT